MFLGTWDKGLKTGTGPGKMGRLVTLIMLHTVRLASDNSLHKNNVTYNSSKPIIDVVSEPKK